MARARYTRSGSEEGVGTELGLEPADPVAETYTRSGSEEGVGTELGLEPADPVAETPEVPVGSSRKLRTSAEIAEAAHSSSRDSPASPWRLRIAKVVLVATGVWWGLDMQLIFYGGAGHPLSQLPNVDWYIGMMLVYAGRCLYGRDAKWADTSQRHIVPIAICDFFGTVGTTIGLEMAGSAIFGIIFASVTVWSALFTYLILKKPQSRLQMAGIAAVVGGLALPAFERSNPDDSADEFEVRLEARPFGPIC